MATLVHIFCKLFELVLILRTTIIHGIQTKRDATWLLVHYQSQAQIAAARRLACELGSQQKTPQPGALMTAVTNNRNQRKLMEEKPHLAVIIPFRDKWKMTRDCIDSLLKQNTENIKLTLCMVDNASQYEETQMGIENLKSDLKAKALSSHDLPVLHILKDERPFNFSELNNAAVDYLTNLGQSSSPDYLLFLNNDTLFESAHSLEHLLFFASSSSRIGAVGCTLLYPDCTVQHLFLAPGVKLAGAHPGKRTKFNSKHLWHTEPRPVAAVTGALLLLATENFRAAQGFDPELATSCQDLDLCLKLQELGLENWVLPNIIVKHLETSTRVKENQAVEIAYTYSKWGATLTMNGFYSPKLTRWSETPALNWGEKAYPWDKVLKSYIR